ncbi:hypothetical protein Q8F55_006068 [Vanrija albida]|uniref:Uncharacterized protein n=1 Tax=Vanrija albida TaxID=181172 RepID=A0ABR3Q3L8_9TREE
MLVRSIALLCLAALAGATPVARPDDAVAPSEAGDTVNIAVRHVIPAPELPERDGNSSTIAERGEYAGLAIRCFNGPRCQGKEIAFRADVYWPRYSMSGQYIEKDLERRISCRFDVWNDWYGKFYITSMPRGMSEGNSKFWHQPRISEEKFDNGSGQYCVEESAGRFNSKDKNLIKLAVAERFK